jgi:acyl-CoA synthetase (AMP-forming)/AMP-acid ligase II
VTANWFGGFTLDHVDVGEAVLRVRTAGPARRCCCCTGIHVLTRHGIASHRSGPVHTRSYARVCGGYGESSKVPTTADHRRTRSGQWPGAAEADLQEHCRNKLAAFEIPKKVYFLDRFPRTAKGSGDRRALAAALARPSSSKPSPEWP